MVMAAFLLPALLVASAAPAATAPMSDSDIQEVDCRVMRQDGAGKIETLLVASLHVLRQAAADGPFRPALPARVNAILCRRSTIIPAEHDDEVLDLGLPLYLSEARPNGRTGVLERSGGQFRFRFVRGTLKPSEAPVMQRRLKLFQDRARRGR